MNKKRLALPLALFLFIFLPTLYFVVRWPSYYQAIKIMVPDTTYQIYLTLLIYFTVVVTLFLSCWAVYLALLILRSKENSSLKPFVAILVLACTAISITAIYRGYVALFKEGFQVSWFRLYSQSLHFSFASDWINMFVIPWLLLGIIFGIIYFISSRKENTLASFALFGSFAILLFWCFILNHYNWSSTMQGYVHQLMGRDIDSIDLITRIFQLYNPFVMINTFFRSIESFFTVIRTFPYPKEGLGFAFRLAPEKMLANVKPSLSFIFYARTLIILALTSFMSFIHYELLKIPHRKTPASS